MKKHKKQLCIDFDRILNCHADKGASEFLNELYLNYEIYILAPKSPDLVKKWLAQNNLAKYVKDVTGKKLQGCAYIDDSGINY